MDSIAEIKSKIDIVDFIGEYIKLRPVGKNYQGLCPFHKDTHPSFYVSPDRQVWKCFGCNRAGDIFSFLQELEGIDFPEALRILAKRAGVNLQKFDKSTFDKRSTLIEICRLSAAFYHQIFLKSPIAEEARSYLEKRGLKESTIKEFCLGFAPDKWDTLFKFLIKRKYSPSDIEAAGLIIPGKKQGQYYDRFRGRIIFPIYNVYGEVIGFTGRILPGAEKKSAEQGKYINTPQTLIYNKSTVLYGINLAKSFIRQADSVVLVEGNMDVISSYQAGVKNVVCSSGTALTEEQIKLLSRYTHNVILAFDVDPAGVSATARSIDLMLAYGINLKIIRLPKGKDPDECIKENPSLWKKAVSESIEFIEYYFSLILKGKKIATLSSKKKAGEKILVLISKIKNSFERDLWLNKLADNLGVSVDSLRERLTEIMKSQKERKKEDEEEEIKEESSLEEEVAKKILALLIKEPKIAPKIVSLSLDILPTTDLRKIARVLKDVWEKEKKFNFKTISKQIQEERLINLIQIALLSVEKEYENFEFSDLEKEYGRLVNYLKKRYFETNIEEKELQLKDAEKNNDKEKIEILSRQIFELIKNSKKIKND
ncbi:MAG: DNA primase [Parcubacteria group bacterium ADurb.Bin159]|nr:MAG: DNA primase [Parcubacteria group bacterium ADurb.Bin159]